MRAICIGCLLVNKLYIHTASNASDPWDKRAERLLACGARRALQMSTQDFGLAFVLLRVALVGVLGLDSAVLPFDDEL